MHYRRSASLAVVAVVTVVTMLVSGCTSGKGTTEQKETQMVKLPAPGVLFTMSEQGLARSKELLANGDSAADHLLAALLTAANGALDHPNYSVIGKPANLLPPGATQHDYVSWAPYFHPVPGNPGAPYVENDGRIVDDQFSVPDLQKFRQLVVDLSNLSVAYSLTGQQKYAGKAADMLSAWFLNPATRMNPSLKYAQVVRNTPGRTPYGVIDVYNMPMIIDAITLLHMGGAMSETMYAALSQWFRQYLDWLTTSPQGVYEGEHFTNNRRTWYYAQVVAVAMFVGDKKLAAQTAEKGKTPIDEQIASDGSQPQEQNRTKIWAYSTYNLGALLRLAWAANNAGVDLFNYVGKKGGSIHEVLDYLAPYAAGSHNWPYAESVRAFDPKQAQPALAMGAYIYPDTEVQKANRQVMPPPVAGLGFMH